MTWAEFNLEVLNFLDVDARRRGIEAFRTAYIKGGLADLESYVPGVKGYFRSYVDADETPYDSEVAEAIAEYLKSKIARNVDRDLQLSQAHLTSYALLRRRLYIRQHEGLCPEIRPWIGKTFTFILDLRVNGLPVQVETNVELTVKRFPGEDDSAKVFSVSRGEGIEVLDETQGRIRVVFTSAQCALLSAVQYYWDVQVEDELHHPLIPISGVLNPRVPVTHGFDPSIMPIDGDPPDDAPWLFI